jgi:hypothetical protein
VRWTRLNAAGFVLLNFHQTSSQEVGSEAALTIDKKLWMRGTDDGKGKPPTDRILHAFAVLHLDEEDRRRGILSDHPDVGNPLRHHPNVTALAPAKEIRVVFFAEIGCSTIKIEMAVALSSS